MDKHIRPVTIRILDKEYMVACPTGEQEALQASAIRVDKEMRKIRDSGKVLGTDRIAVMVALNLAHELMHGNHSHATNGDPEAIAQLFALQGRIDAILEKHKA